MDTIPDNAVARLLGGIQWLEHGDVAKIHAFCEAHDAPQAKLAIRQHRERLDVHAKLRARV